MADEFDMEEFDFPEDPDLGDSIGDVDGPGGDNRGAVVRDVSSVLKSEVSSSKISKSFRDNLLKAVPSEKIQTEIDDAMYAVDDLVEMGSDNINKLRKGAAGVVGGAAGLLPEFMSSPLNNLKDLLNPDEDGYSSGREESEDEKISNEVNNLLTGVTKEALDNQRNQILEELNGKKEEELLSNMAGSLGAMANVGLVQDSKFHKRSLELQLKQTFTLVKMHEIMVRDSELHTKQLEAIARSTSLPDFAKSMPEDIVKEKLLSTIGNFGEEAFGSIGTINRIKSSVTNLVNDKVSSFLTTADMIKDTAGSLAEASEQGISPLQMLVGSVVGDKVNDVTKAVSDRLMENALKSSGNKEALNNLHKYTTDMDSGLALLEKEALDENGEATKESAIYSFLREMAGNGEIKKGLVLQDSSKLNEAAQMDNKLKLSINKVIPSLLTKILGEVTTIRKGNNVVDGADVLNFDYAKNTFVSSKTVSEEVKAKMDDKSKMLFDSLANKGLIDKLLPNHSDLTDDQRKEFALGMFDYLVSGKSLSPYFMQDANILDNFTDPRLKKKINAGLTSLVKAADTEDGKRELEDVQAMLTGIKERNITTNKNIISGLEHINDSDILASSGLTDKNDQTMVSHERAINNAREGLVNYSGNLKEFFDGGYTGDYDIKKVAGVTHGKEYVIPANDLTGLVDTVRNQDLAGMKDVIEEIVTDVASKSKDIKLDVVTDSFKSMTKTLDNLLKPMNNMSFTKEPLTPINNLSFNPKQNETIESKLKDMGKSIGGMLTNITTTAGGITDSAISYGNSFMDSVPKSWDEALATKDSLMSSFKDSDSYKKLELIKSVADDVGYLETGKLLKDEALDRISRTDFYKESHEKLAEGVQAAKSSKVGKEALRLGESGLNEFKSTADKLGKFGSTLKEDIDKDGLFKTGSDRLDSLNKEFGNTGFGKSMLEMLASGKTGANLTLDSLTSFFKRDHSLDSETLERLGKLDNALQDNDLEKVLTKALQGMSFPATEEEAVKTYKELLISLDPSGKLYEGVASQDGYIGNLQSLHTKALATKQLSLLEDSDDDKEASGNRGFLADMKSRILSIVPAPLRSMFTSFMETKLGKYFKNTLGNLGKAFKGAGKTVLQGLSGIGKNAKELIYDEKTGAYHVPNLLDTAKFVGKSGITTTKALSAGIKELYPALGGIAIDTLKGAADLAVGATGLRGSMKRGKARMKAFVKPPIDRKLYKAWTSGELTAEEVLDTLTNEEDKTKWVEWLKANKREGFTLMDALSTGGSWYLKSVKGAGTGIRTGVSAAGGILNIGKKASNIAGKFMFGSKFKGFDTTKEKIKKDEEEREELKEEIDELKEELDGIKKDDTKFNDKDGDGVRDGDRTSRFKKLFGKKDKAKDVKDSTVKTVVKKGGSIFSSLLKFLPVLAPVLLSGFTKVGKSIVNSIGNIGSDVWSYIKLGGKTLFKNISKLFTPLLAPLGTLTTSIGGAISTSLKGVAGFLGLKTLTNVKQPTTKNPSVKPKTMVDKVKTKKPKIKVKTSSIKAMLNRFRRTVGLKLGKRAAVTAMSKIASRFVPMAGQALLAWDAIKIGKYMLADKLPFRNAVSKQILGMDLFKKGVAAKITHDVTNSSDISAGLESKLDALDSKPTLKEDNAFKSTYKPANNYLNKQDSKGGDGFTPKDAKEVKNKIPSTATKIAAGNLYSPMDGESNLIVNSKEELAGLQPAMRDNLFSMANEYYELTGNKLKLNSAYRSYAKQAALRKKYGNKAARPGYSMHEFGLAFDTNTTIVESLNKLGLLTKYGFTVPVGKESWHVEPIGIQSSLAAIRANPALADKLVKESLLKGGGTWGLGSNKKQYSRSKDYEEAVMNRKPTTLPTPVLKDGSKDSSSDVVSSLPKSDYSSVKQKPIPAVVNVVNSNSTNTTGNDNLGNNSVSETSVTVNKSLDLQHKLLKVQTDSLSVQKEMLALLQSSNKNRGNINSTNNSSNNANIEVSPLVDHSLKNF